MFCRNANFISIGEGMEAKLTNCCMIKRGNEVLVQDRKKDFWPGVAFPGGKVDINESIVESTIREIKEETGLDISNLKFRGFKSWFDKKEGKDFWEVIFFFETSNFSGELIEECREGTHKWVNIDELLMMKLAEGFEEDLKVFLSDDSVEMFYRKNGDNDNWNLDLFSLMGDNNE